MAVQKSKKSKSKRGMRRSHDSLKLQRTVIDKESGVEFLYHHISPCGFYKGKKIIDIKSKQRKD